MIEKTTTIATLEWDTENETVIVRERVAIVEDGEELSHSFIHKQFKADSDWSGEAAQVQAMCQAAFA
jgi:hypothetical protein